ncbi:UNVERIFIED_CONTAM: hypothetical protein NCL1_50837 [Trichonephila clavipes]
MSNRGRRNSSWQRGFSYESDSTNKFAVSNVLNTLGCDFSFDESFRYLLHQFNSKFLFHSPEAYSSSVLETSMQQEQQVPVILNDSDLSRIPASSLYIHPQSNLSPLQIKGCRILPYIR